MIRGVCKEGGKGNKQSAETRQTVSVSDVVLVMNLIQGSNQMLHESYLIVTGAVIKLGQAGVVWISKDAM